MPEQESLTPEIAKLHNCQTPKCGNPYEAIVLWVGDSKAQYFCVSCFCAFFARVVQGLAAEADGLVAADTDGLVVQNAPAG